MRGHFDSTGSFRVAAVGRIRDEWVERDMQRRRSGMQTKRARILVAEDDQELRRIIVEMLRHEGHDVFEVGDGATLLTELARNPCFNYDVVDVIVADVRMPLCSGIQALEAVRHFRKQLPFVLLTAFGDDELHAQAKRLDAVLIDKPVSMDDLRAVIAVTMANAQVPRPSRSSIR